MKIDKAIEILETDHTKPVSHTVKDYLDALKLGIEALKRCQHNYLSPQRADLRLLPGETES